jgi:hypothetical protein
MSVPDGDLQTLLRAMLEQQTALLNVQAENMRLQRVLIERLLGSDATAPVPSAPAELPSLGSSAPESRPATTMTLSEFAATHSATPVGFTPQLPRAVREPSPPEAAASATLLPTPREPARIAAASGQEEPVATRGAPSSRGERYYRAQPVGDALPTRPMSLEALNVLRSIQSVGDLGRLMLTFGPHAGETLGQIALSDADYLRRLATTGQRADVRAAAARLMEALPPSPAPHGRQPALRTRRGAWRASS